MVRTLFGMQQVPRSLRHVVVIGLMGVGQELRRTASREAARLGRGATRTATSRRSTGLTVRELRDRDGVEAMHDREARQLLDALADPDPSVISAAASTIEVAGVPRGR